jgi:hypothetical protein
MLDRALHWQSSWQLSARAAYSPKLLHLEAMHMLWQNSITPQYNIIRRKLGLRRMPSLQRNITGHTQHTTSPVFPVKHVLCCTVLC